MTTDTRTTLALGSWSIGSTRAEDWAAAALDMANSVRIDYSDELVISGETDFDYLARWLRHYREHEACDGETFGAHYRQCPLVDDFPSEALAAAIDALQEYAPIYCYVGAHGADFGVWLDHDALERAVVAVPRLLEALERLLVGIDSAIEQADVDEAREAVRQARGEQP